MARTYTSRIRGITGFLIYLTIPATSGAAADIVIGQPSMNQNGLVTSPLTSALLNNPKSVMVAGGKLVICDSANNRVLIYNSVPAANFPAANVVIGYPDFVNVD